MLMYGMGWGMYVCVCFLFFFSGHTWMGRRILQINTHLSWRLQVHCLFIHGRHIYPVCAMNSTYETHPCYAWLKYHTQPARCTAGGSPTESVITQLVFSSFSYRYAYNPYHARPYHHSPIIKPVPGITFDRAYLSVPCPSLLQTDEYNGCTSIKIKCLKWIQTIFFICLSLVKKV